LFSSHYSVILYRDFFSQKIAHFTPLSQPGKSHKGPQKKARELPRLSMVKTTFQNSLVLLRRAVEQVEVIPAPAVWGEHTNSF
jgi:hypothetical protein